MGIYTISSEFAVDYKDTEQYSYKAALFVSKLNSNGVTAMKFKATTNNSNKKFYFYPASSTSNKKVTFKKGGKT